MYGVSADYLAAIADDSPIVRMTGTITLADTSTVSITDALIMQGSLHIDEQAVDGDDIGLGACRGVEFACDFKTSEDLSGAVIEPIFGLLTSTGPDVWEDIPLGKFYVADIERLSASVVRVTCGDDMLTLDMPVGTPPASGTPYDYLDYIASTAGITFEQSEATINAMPNGAYTITYPAQSEIKTLRHLLRGVVQLLGGFACFNRDAKLEVRHFAGVSVRTISTPGRENTKISDEQKTVSGVSITLNGTTYTEANTPDLGYTILLQDNPLIRGESAANISTILTAALGEVDGIAYYPASFNWRRGDPALEIGDNVKLVDGVAGAGVGTLITNNRWEYRKVQSIGGVGKGLVARAYESIAEAKLQSKADYFYVDHLYSQDISADKITTGILNAERIASGSIISKHIAAGAITTEKIAANAITAESGIIADAVVGDAQIDHTSANKIQVIDADIVSVTASKITAGTIDATDIDVINLNADNLTVGTINGQRIAEGSITEEKIADLAVTAEKIANGCIDADKIQDGAITSDKIAFGSIKESQLNWSTHLIF